MDRWCFMLQTEQLIDKLKGKGVTFQKCTIKDAISFLNEHNYYVKVTAYKTNFHKHNGKYVGLDFMALKDLSTIDMYLRRWIISASLSVEHSLKVNILKNIQEKNIDEFSIVSEYIAKYPRIITELNNRRSTAYVKTILGKYTHPKYPIYVFLEVIPFGEFVNFYKYYCSKYEYNEFNCTLLDSIRNIRNAAAHSNCVIHDLTNKDGFYNSYLASRLVELLPDIRKRTIQNRLKNNCVQDFISLLIAVDDVIKSEDLKNHCLQEIKELFDGRMISNRDLYKSSTSVQQMYAFCKEIVYNVQPS